MSWDFKTFFIRIAALGAAACSSVYAVHSAPNDALVKSSRPAVRSPFEVELVADDGRTLDTYSRGGRFYVLGQHGTRYSIRVKNPTAQRVEAVISVDGLDVIDGEDANFTGKRGYVVPPYGDLVVDGFRTSTTQVAAFRFSAVADSYAERKGKGRNVGVIGVAIFAEKAAPQVIVPQPTHRGPHDDFGGDEAEESGGFRGHADKPAASKGEGRVGSGTTAPAEASPAPPPHGRRATRDLDTSKSSETCCGPTRRERPGLGTQFGEGRFSAVDFTRFVRASNKPVAMAELRYNDADGLRALGIRLHPEPDHDELMRRETADAFPGQGYAAPPP